MKKIKTIEKEYANYFDFLYRILKSQLSRKELTKLPKIVAGNQERRIKNNIYYHINID